jgi:cellulose biosynthesis protein BcsQ
MSAEKKQKTEAPIIGIFTEKGGTGKSTFSFFLTRSKCFSKMKILVIDADPQSNYSHCSLSPSMVKGLNFYNIANFIENNGNINNLYKPIENISVITGSPIKSEVEAQLTNELKSPLQNNIKEIKSKIEKLKADYDIIMIDFNPTYSTVNVILLSMCSQVVSLLTCDIFSQGSVSTLVNFRKDRLCQFNLFLIPSMMIYRGDNLRPAYDSFNDKILNYIKEQHTKGDTFLKYAGVIRRVDDLAKKKPIEFLKKPSSADGNITIYRKEMEEIAKLLLSGDGLKITPPSVQFPWSVVNPNLVVKKPQRLLYTCYDGIIYKIGQTDNWERRNAELDQKFKTKFKIVTLFLTNEEIADDVEDKIKCYLSTDEDQGESVSNPLFGHIIELLKNKLFIESLLLEV